MRSYRQTQRQHTDHFAITHLCTDCIGNWLSSKMGGRVWIGVLHFFTFLKLWCVRMHRHKPKLIAKNMPNYKMLIYIGIILCSPHNVIKLCYLTYSIEWNAALSRDITTKKLFKNPENQLNVERFWPRRPKVVAGDRFKWSSAIIAPDIRSTRESSERRSSASLPPFVGLLTVSKKRIKPD